MTKLDHELVWDAGHLSEVARQAAADGQLTLLEDDAARHLEECEACAAAVGEMALASVELGVAVRAAASADVPVGEAPTAYRFPWKLVAAAVVLAAAGAAPAFSDRGASLVRQGVSMLQETSMLVSSTLAIAHAARQGLFAPLLSVACASLLALMGFAVARAHRAPSTAGVSR